MLFSFRTNDLGFRLRSGRQTPFSEVIGKHAGTISTNVAKHATDFPTLVRGSCNASKLLLTFGDLREDAFGPVVSDEDGRVLVMVADGVLNRHDELLHVMERQLPRRCWIRLRNPTFDRPGRGSGPSPVVLSFLRANEWSQRVQRVERALHTVRTIEHSSRFLTSSANSVERAGSSHTYKRI